MPLSKQKFCSVFLVLFSLGAAGQRKSLIPFSPDVKIDPCYFQLVTDEAFPFKKRSFGSDTVLRLTQRRGIGPFGPYFRVEGILNGEPLPHGAMIALYSQERLREKRPNFFQEQFLLAQRLFALDVGPAVVGRVEKEEISAIIYSGLEGFSQDITVGTDSFPLQNMDHALEEVAARLIQGGVSLSSASVFGKNEKQPKVLLCSAETASEFSPLSTEQEVNNFTRSKLLNLRYRSYREIRDSSAFTSKDDLRRNLEEIRTMIRNLESMLSSFGDIEFSAEAKMPSKIGYVRVLLYLWQFIEDVTSALLANKEWNTDLSAVSFKARKELAYFYGKQRELILVDPAFRPNIPKRVMAEVDFLAYQLDWRTLRRTKSFVDQHLLRMWEHFEDLKVPHHAMFGELLYLRLKSYSPPK